MVRGNGIRGGPTRAIYKCTCSERIGSNSNGNIAGAAQRTRSAGWRIGDGRERRQHTPRSHSALPSSLSRPPLLARLSPLRRLRPARPGVRHCVERDSRVETVMTQHSQSSALRRQRRPTPRSTAGGGREFRCRRGRVHEEDTKKMRMRLYVMRERLRPR